MYHQMFIIGASFFLILNLLLWFQFRICLSICFRISRLVSQLLSDELNLKVKENEMIHDYGSSVILGASNWQ